MTVRGGWCCFVDVAVSGAGVTVAATTGFPPFDKLRAGFTRE